MRTTLAFEQLRSGLLTAQLITQRCQNQAAGFDSILERHLTWPDQDDIPKEAHRLNFHRFPIADLLAAPVAASCSSLS